MENWSNGISVKGRTRFLPLTNLTQLLQRLRLRKNIGSILKASNFKEISEFIIFMWNLPNTVLANNSIFKPIFNQSITEKSIGLIHWDANKNSMQCPCHQLYFQYLICSWILNQMPSKASYFDSVMLPGYCMVYIVMR